MMALQTIKLGMGAHKTIWSAKMCYLSSGYIHIWSSFTHKEKQYTISIIDRNLSVWLLYVRSCFMHALTDGLGVYRWYIWWWKVVSDVTWYDFLNCSRIPLAIVFSCAPVRPLFLRNVHRWSYASRISHRMDGNHAAYCTRGSRTY